MSGGMVIDLDSPRFPVPSLIDPGGLILERIGQVGDHIGEPDLDLN